ncbi:MAG: DUF6602 domain-containing protein [Polyangiaceae bacterium]
MDVRESFLAASRRLRDGFRKTKTTRDSRGKGTQRERVVVQELEKILPDRYSCGSGEIVTFENRASQECDVIIYDSSKLPTILREEGHTVFPFEAVYGLVQVKSTLTSTELERAYTNVSQAKSIIPAVRFSALSDGFGRGYAPARPVAAVFAFKGGRALETIAAQVAALDKELPRIDMRPDFVAVLDEGIIGPRTPLRGPSNFIEWPKAEELSRIRRTGVHTWMRFCLQLIRELNTLRLPPLDLLRYLRMPALVAGHRVSGHDGLLMSTPSGSQVYRLTSRAIRKIVENCATRPPITMRDYFTRRIGRVPEQADIKELENQLRLYDEPASQATTATGGPPAPKFRDLRLKIDDEVYVVNLYDLEDRHDFEKSDLPEAELFE